MRGRLVFFVAVMAMVFFSAQGIAATIYVDQSNASGVEDGSVDNPYNTIMEGINNAANGDTVRVAAGTYNENVVIFGLQVRVVGESPVNTTVQAPGDVFSVSGAYETGAEQVEIANFTITGGTRAGIFLSSGTVFGLIHNNLIMANGRGIYANDSAASIVNNTILNSFSDGIYGCDHRAKLNASGNIICDNGRYGIYAYSYSVINSMYNNVWNNVAGEYEDYHGTAAVNPIGDLSRAPVFASNYQLSAESPCIDAGSPIATDNDPDGTRNDQGAYGGPGAADFWPQSAGGPIVTDLVVTPQTVPVGGTISFHATGEIR